MPGPLPQGELLPQGVIDIDELTVACGVERYTHATGRPPGIVIVSPDSAHDGSARYMRGKVAVGNRLGITVGVEERDTLEGIYNIIDSANEDPAVNGIIVQLPLSRDIAEHTHDVLERVDPQKDIDGLGTATSQIPATARAVDSLLQYHGIDIEEEAIVLNGLGVLSNGPLQRLWLDRGAKNVVGIDLDVDPYARIAAVNDARVIVSATGQPGLLTPELFLPGAGRKVLVDVGTAGTAKANETSQQGDISAELRLFAQQNGWGITPLERGVGALTIRKLYLNMLATADAQAELPPLTKRDLVLRTTSAHPLKGIKSSGQEDRAFDPYFIKHAVVS